jgi:hypothetical protein
MGSNWLTVAEFLFGTMTKFCTLIAMQLCNTVNIINVTELYTKLVKWEIYYIYFKIRKI